MGETASSPEKSLKAVATHAPAGRPWRMKGAWSDGPFIAGLGLIGGFYVLLILALVAADVGFLYRDFKPGNFWGSLTEPFAAIVQSPDIRFALWLTLVTCFVSAVLSLAVGVPLGYVMSRYSFPGKQVVDAVLDIPIVLPPLVIGLSLLILFQTMPGKFVERLSGEYLTYVVTYGAIPLAVGWVISRLFLVAAGHSGSIGLRWAFIVGLMVCFAILLLVTPVGGQAYSFLHPHLKTITYAVPAVVLAQFSVAAAFSVRTMRVAFDQVSPRSEQVAMTLGCSRAEAFTRVVLPEVRRGILTAGTLAWARSLGEFGPILVFAGATRQRTEVLSTTVFLELSIGNINAAVAVSLLMIFVAMVVLLIVRVFGGRPMARAM